MTFWRCDRCGYLEAGHPRMFPTPPRCARHGELEQVTGRETVLRGIRRLERGMG